MENLAGKTIQSVVNGICDEEILITFTDGTQVVVDIERGYDGEAWPTLAHPTQHDWGNFRIEDLLKAGAVSKEWAEAYQRDKEKAKVAAEEAKRVRRQADYDKLKKEFG